MKIPLLNKNIFLAIFVSFFANFSNAVQVEDIAKQRHSIDEQRAKIFAKKSALVNENEILENKISIANNKLIDLQKEDKNLTIQNLQKNINQLENILSEISSQTQNSLNSIFINDFLNSKKDISSINKILEKMIFQNEKIGQIALVNGDIQEAKIFYYGKFLFAKNDNVSALFVDKKNLYPSFYKDVDKALLENLENNSPAFIGLNFSSVANEKESFIQSIKKGGFWASPIIFLFVICSITIILKTYKLLFIKTFTNSDIDKISNYLENNNIKEAQNFCKKFDKIFYNPLKMLLQNLSLDKIALEDLSYENTICLKTKLEKGLFILSITAVVSPLLGLLGTVSGMISTFGLIELFGTQNPKYLSGGISEALITTEYGLIVAIPALIAHALFMKKSKSIVNSFENLSQKIINHSSK